MLPVKIINTVVIMVAVVELQLLYNCKNEKVIEKKYNGRNIKCMTEFISMTRLLKIESFQV